MFDFSFFLASGLLLFIPVTLLFCWEIKQSDCSGIQHKQTGEVGRLEALAQPQVFLLVFLWHL